MGNNGPPYAYNEKVEEVRLRKKGNMASVLMHTRDSVLYHCKFASPEETGVIGRRNLHR